jgi:hypothetical protein
MSHHFDAVGDKLKDLYAQQGKLRLRIRVQTGDGIEIFATPRVGPRRLHHKLTSIDECPKTSDELRDRAG